MMYGRSPVRAIPRKEVFNSSAACLEMARCSYDKFLDLTNRQIATLTSWRAGK